MGAIDACMSDAFTRCTSSRASLSFAATVLGMPNTYYVHVCVSHGSVEESLPPRSRLCTCLPGPWGRALRACAPAPPSCKCASHVTHHQHMTNAAAPQLPPLLCRSLPLSFIQCAVRLLSNLAHRLPRVTWSPTPATYWPPILCLWSLLGYFQFIMYVNRYVQFWTKGHATEDVPGNVIECRLNSLISGGSLLACLDLNVVTYMHACMYSNEPTYMGRFFI